MVDFSTLKFLNSPQRGWKDAQKIIHRDGRHPGNRITHVVIHVTQGDYPGCANWLCNPHNGRVSAHYCVSRAGEIVQIVRDQDQAWHACNANPFTLGVEHEGFIEKSNLITPELWKASVDLVSSLCRKYNIPVNHVIGHNDPFLKQFGNNHQDPGPRWDMLKYRNDLQTALNTK